MEKVKARLLKATFVLENAGILYAVAGENAVAAWVTTVDEAAVRNTRDVDILLRREDLPCAIQALEAYGFVYRRAAGLDLFLDGPDAKARDAVHIVFAGEKVRDHEVTANPDVIPYVEADGYRILTLEHLVQIKLTAFRDKNRTHLRDLLDVGLINESWKVKYSTELGDRLQLLIDTPEG